MAPLRTLFLCFALLVPLTGCGYLLPAGALALIDNGKDKTVIVPPGADLVVSRGPRDSGATNEGKGVTTVASQLRLTATEASRVSSIRVTASGSGNDVALGPVRLHQDANGDGLLDGSDPLLGSAPFAADDGVVTFSGLNVPFAAAESIDLLVVITTPAGASDGETFSVGIASASDVTAVTDPAGRPVPVLGAPLPGSVKTISQTGTLTVLLGPNNPSAGSSAFANGMDRALLQLELRASTAEALTLDQLVLRTSGSGDESTDLAGVDLYEDVDGDGALSGVDLPIALGQLPAGNDGDLTFAALAQTLSPGAIRRWLVLYDLNGAASNGETFALSWTNGSDLSVTGQTSLATITPLGAPLGGSILVTRASLTVALGPGNVAQTATPGATEREVLRLQLTAGPAEPVVVSSLLLTGVGSGDEPTELSSVLLVQDLNGDGQVDPGDTVIAGPTTYGAGSTLLFGGLTEVVDAGQAETWLVAYDVAASATGGDQFQTTLTGPGDVSASGQTSLLPVTPTLPPLGGGVLTVTGSLSLGPATAPPPAQTRLVGDADVPVLTLRLSAGLGETVRLTSLTVTPSGSGDDQNGVTLVELFQDVDMSGTFSAGDLPLDSGTFPADDTPLVFFNGGGLIDIGPSSAVELLVRYQLSTQPADGDTFSAQVTRLGVVSSGLGSGVSLSAGGNTVTSNTLTAERPQLALTPGPQNPAATNVLQGATQFPMLQVELSAGLLETVDVTQLRFRGQGTANELSDVVQAQLWLDAGTTPGAVDAGDTPLGTQTFAANNGLVSFSGAPLLNVATTATLLLTYDVSSAAPAGATFTALLETSGDVTASGVTSGASADVSGAPVTGGVKTVQSVLTLPALSVSATVAIPPSALVLPSATDVLALPLLLSETSGNEGVRVTGLRLVASGSGDDATDVDLVRLWRDVNGDGALDGGDVPLSLSAYFANDGVVTFLGLNETVAASGTLALLVTYDFEDETQVVPPEDYAATLTAANLDAESLLGAVALTPTGSLPLTGTTLIASAVPTAQVTISQAVALPDGTVAPDDADVGVIQLQLEETSGVAAVDLSSLTLRTGGTGQENSDVLFVELWRDSPPIGSRDVGDVRIGLSAIFADDGPFTFGGLSEVVPVSGTLDLLVTYDFASAAEVSNGETYLVSLQAGDVTLSEQGTGTAIVPTGLPETGPTLTASTAAGGQLTVQAGPANPTSTQKAANGAKDQVVFQLQLAADAVQDLTVDALEIQASGSGDDTTIAGATLYRDLDGSGTLSAGDTVIQTLSSPFAMNDGAAIFAPLGETIPLSTTVQWLLAYDLGPGNTANDGFTAQVMNATKVTLSTAGATVVGTFPVTGATYEIVGTLTASVGATNPTGSTTTIPEADVEVFQLTLAADGAEDLTIDGLGISVSGTADDTTAFSSKALYYDDGDGVYEPGADDVLVQTLAGGFPSNDGTASFGPALAETIMAGTSRTYWFAVDVDAAALSGTTLRASLSAPGDLTVTGVTSAAPPVVNGTPVNSETFSLGAAAGLFAPPVPIALTTAETVQDLGVGDFDRDGSLDFVALRGDGFLEVHRGQGDGMFSATQGPFPVAALTGATRLAVGDVDRDGFVDVVVMQPGQIAVLLNDQAGNLGSPTTVSGGADQQDIALVDYDRDGDLDVLTTNASPRRILGYSNQGAGTFVQDEFLAMGGVTPSRFDLADMNQDGILDALLVDPATNRAQGVLGDGSFFFVFNGNPLLSGVPQDVVAVDLDRDGYPEAAVDTADDSYSGLENQRPGANNLVVGAGPTASSTSAPRLTVPRDMVSGDWDGDGRPDLAITHLGAGAVDEGVAIHLGNDTFALAADGTAYAAGTDPDRIAVGDFDRDGDPDLLVASSVTAGPVQLLLGDGLTLGGSTTVGPLSQTLPFNARMVQAEVADLNRDGQPDVVSVSRSAELQGYTNDGAGVSFTTVGGPTVLPMGPVEGMRVGDFNRDGIPDVVVCIDALITLTGNGDGTFAAPVTLTTLGFGVTDVGLGDLDGDGLPDAVLCESTSDALQIFRGDGTGFAAAQMADRLTTSVQPERLRLADVNNDGRLDIVVACHTANNQASAVDAFLNQGGMVFTRVSSPMVQQRAFNLALGDINRDGWVDAVVSSKNEQLIEVFQGNGDGTFTSQGSVAADKHDLELADLDKDGDLDLAQARTTGGIGTYTNTDPATFTFAAVQLRASVGDPLSVGLGDLNRDGDLDLISAGDAPTGGILVYFGE